MDAIYVTDFIKDTTFLVVIAYLLTRGRLLRLLFHQRLKLAEAFFLGVPLGLISLGVSLLPDVGFQYPSQTLFTGFATLVGGLYVGLIVAVITSLNTILAAPHRVIEALVGVIVISPFAVHLRGENRIALRMIYGFMAGALIQTCRLFLQEAQWNFRHLPLLSSSAGLSIPISGFGVALLLLVVSDAQLRADSERHLMEAEKLRVETEHAHAIASEAQLIALRARIHPHFLFNTLNAIAELCCIAPERAEKACLNLSQLMRQTLETSTATSIPLAQELAMTNVYLQIEQERWGERLSVLLQIDSHCEKTPIIPFSVQVLVENAINHGLSPKPSLGTVSITVRKSARYTLIAVTDDGIGMPPRLPFPFPEKDGQPTHGLEILNRQLVLRAGNRARLRFFRRDTGGTLVTFALPDDPPPAKKEIKEETKA